MQKQKKSCHTENLIVWKIGERCTKCTNGTCCLPLAQPLPQHPPCVYHVHSLTVSANLSERTTTAQVFSAFVFGAYSIRHSERQWERDGDTLGPNCMFVCECNGECVSCPTTISSSKARVRETTLAENCCWFGQLVSGSACSKSSVVRGAKGGGTSQQVRAGQRIDQAQQLRQAKQQLTRFIVCLQVPTVSHSLLHRTALTHYFSVFVRKCCCRYSYF